MTHKNESLTHMQQLNHNIENISEEIFQHFLNKTSSDSNLGTFLYFEVKKDNSDTLKAIGKKQYYLYAFRVSDEKSRTIIYVGKVKKDFQRFKRHLQWMKDDGKPYAESYRCKAEEVQAFLKNGKDTLTLCLYQNKDLTAEALLALESCIIEKGKKHFGANNWQQELKSWNMRNG